MSLSVLSFKAGQNTDNNEDASHREKGFASVTGKNPDMAQSRGVKGPLESAESDVRGDESPIPTHDERTEQRNLRAAAEVKRLRAWAFDQYGNAARTLKLPNTFIGRGAEHEVYGDPRRNRVIKVTRKSDPATYGFGISLNNDGQGATAGEYLDRLCLQNRIFNDDVRLEGVHTALGSTKIVTSQPFVDDGPAAPLQIDAYMIEKGFEPLAEGTYYHLASGILVHDLFPRNAVVTPEGNVRAIDPAIMRATPALAAYIVRRTQL